MLPDIFLEFFGFLSWERDWRCWLVEATTWSLQKQIHYQLLKGPENLYKKECFLIKKKMLPNDEQLNNLLLQAFIERN